MENLPTIRTNMPRRWYVIYTRPRWEKKVDELLKLQGITSYCPTRKVKNQWADRVKEVELPIFNSYVFVFINPREELKVRVTLGVLNFVYYMGKPAQVRDSVIEDIKHCLEVFPDTEVLAMQYLEVGDRVKIKEGLMNLKEGKVVKIQERTVIVVIDTLNCVLTTKVAINSLELIN
ncbi:antitermination protein NusG [Pedobacter ginsengisoli]|uniref:Antitermination protein NusG n=1 Tax=Pedobacter ginsengisoli TaxID=363852 RepID=A0A2D1U397_9SPHI|nr:UpxY family transcription antiterminator [Pedobacter ginsengisoli]ATP56087.1 antitermination protein NusG [Pedobacter ginsengisoli]